MVDKVKLLLVDDFEENLLALEALLQAEDREILKATSGPQALELVLAHDFALALLDIQMPGMDGFELAELMRGAERSKRIPIIFLTAGTAERLREFRGYESGAVDVLFKPIDPMVLQQKVSTFHQLYRQKQQLERSVQIRDDVLAIVSHDLRTPLSVIHASTSLFLDPRYTPSPEQAREQYRRILRNVETMNRMIGDLLDMANLRTGRLSMQRSVQPVSLPLRECVLAHQPVAAEKGLRFEHQLPGEEVLVDCDRARLVQALSNLLGNAIKFSRPGDSVSLRARREEGVLIAEVADTGPGIASEELPHIFDPYWSSRRHKSAGTGLGLYIAKGIVEAHGGQLRVATRAGQGTTFTLTLPTAEP